PRPTFAPMAAITWPSSLGSADSPALALPDQDAAARRQQRIVRDAFERLAGSNRFMGVANAAVALKARHHVDHAIIACAEEPFAHAEIIARDGQKPSASACWRWCCSLGHLPHPASLPRCHYGDCWSGLGHLPQRCW